MLTPSQRKLVEAIRDYANNTLNGQCPDEGCGILSALVNTVDTAMERELFGYSQNRLQVEREVILVEFLVAHDNNNTYQLK
jgi:hypothetical protein